MTQILMPKATAVWLIDNTGLTFQQISEFCSLHILEVEGIADGDVAAGIRGADPIANGQINREEIEKAEKDPSYAMKSNSFDSDNLVLSKPSKKGPRYTPLSRRQDRPDAIAWMVRNHPEVTDAQISRLIGTTKPTIKSIRDRTHWKINTINPTDPVSLGLCSQIDLDALVKKAADKKAKEDEKLAAELGESDGLKPLDTPAPAPAVEKPKVEHTLESLFKPSTQD
ncbi:cell cycle transcriptional regulator TrcR [Litorimonas sp. RW-G-Af-16]|uniref:cell cycle transcriptional regulator TrcR n=1 Tax=Litorimonas sp. RW-G-Af-16 TaxID=3241168 RepID=UPI00390C6282